MIALQLRLSYPEVLARLSADVVETLLREAIVRTCPEIPRAVRLEWHFAVTPEGRRLVVTIKTNAEGADGRAAAIESALGTDVRRIAAAAEALRRHVPGEVGPGLAGDVAHDR